MGIGAQPDLDDWPEEGPPGQQDEEVDHHRGEKGGGENDEQGPLRSS